MIKHWWFMLGSRAAWKRAELAAIEAKTLREAAFDQNAEAESTKKMKKHIADSIRFAEIAHGKRPI